MGTRWRFLHDVDAINRRRRERTVALVREQAGGELDGVRVCVLGAAFKPHSDDVRDAPALDVARMLQEEGAQVVVFDPQAMDNARRTHPELWYADSVLEAASDADVVALLTEWDQFKALDPRWLGRLVATARGRRRPARAGPADLARGRLDLPHSRTSLTFATGVPPTCARTDLLDKCGSCVSGGCKDGVVRTMNAKKALLVLVVVFLGFWMFTDPRGLAQAAQDAAAQTWSLAEQLFSAVIDFVGALT